MRFIIIHFIVFLTFLFSCNDTIAQTSFSKAVLWKDVIRSTVSILSVDLNKDNHDDIVTFDNGIQLTVLLNNFLERDWKVVKGPILHGKIISAVACDLNNDGNMEIILTTPYKEIRAYTYNWSASEFRLYWTSEEEIYAQNLSVSDINNDGWSDLLVCNDDGENLLYLNNKGILEISSLVNFSTVKSSDNSGNYSSIFVDIDLDGDDDIYVSKCRGLAQDPTDPRRINQLLLNENGQYRDVADELGLASGAQSWVTNFADLDLDGDLDAVVVNHYSDIQLFEHTDSGSFVLRSSLSGVNTNKLYFQQEIIDMDNDGYEDIVLSGPELLILYNKGNLNFEKSVISTNAFTFTSSDYNHDGAIDLYIGYGGVEDIGAYPDSIFFNQNNQHNWITFTLSNSAKEIEGARIIVYSDGISRQKWIRKGYSYGTQNSSQLHFGLGDSEIDSVKVIWNTGETETRKDLEINSFYYWDYQKCFGKLENIEISTKDVCVDSDFEIKGSKSFLNWSTGERSINIDYDDSRPISSQYTIESCKLNSWWLFPIKIDTGHIADTTVLLDNGFQFCSNELAEIKALGNDVRWHDGSTQPIFLSNEEGIYYVTYTDKCLDYERTYLRKDTKSNFNVESNIIQFDNGDDVVIDVGSSQARWYWEEDSSTPFHHGSELKLQKLITDKTLYVEDYIEQSYTDFLGAKIPTQENYPPSIINPRTQFTVNQEVLLESIGVKTEVSGKRRIEIFNSKGIFWDSLYMIDDATSRIELNVVLPVGTYSIGTNENENISNFQTKGPYLVKGDASYPYVDQKAYVSIDGNTIGATSSVYFFFNWKVRSLDTKQCISQREKIELKQVSLTDNKEISITYNSIVQDYLYFSSPNITSLEVFDVNGKMLYHEANIFRVDIDMTIYPSGLYFIKTNQGVYRFVKVN